MIQSEIDPDAPLTMVEKVALLSLLLWPVFFSCAASMIGG